MCPGWTERVEVGRDGLPAVSRGYTGGSSLAGSHSAEDVTQRGHVHHTGQHYLTLSKVKTISVIWIFH